MFASRPALLRFAAVLTLLSIAMVGIGGCAKKKDKSEIAVATVGDNTISLAYFELKMNSIPPEELPQDIALQSGREELLETMIKKEVMVLKALELGMDEDGSVQEQASRIANLTAVTNMRADITADAQEVSEEEIQNYYEMLPRKLMTSYMLFDYLKPALEARALVEGGEQWATVARQYKAGAPGRDDNYTMPIVYGTVADDFERAVFSLPVGAISEPIDSPYGYFVVRVNDVEFERVQPLDSIRDKVVASVRAQKEQLAITDFLDQVFDEYKLVIDDDVLKIAFEGIPADVPLTPPYPDQASLEKLNIDSKDLDKVLMSFADQSWTLARYKEFFDASSLFGRPRREAGAGPMRRALKETAIRELMDRVALDRGYGEAENVRAEFRTRREQIMVNRLNTELVRDQVEVTPEEVDAYYDEHMEDFRRPELRDTLALITETEADCLAAQIDLAGGATWEQVVEKYCVPSDVREAKGVVGKMAPTATSRVKDIVFSLEEGETSRPTELEDGRWALVRVLTIEPSIIPDISVVRVTAGARLRGIREDALFDSLIARWAEDYEIKRYPERLMDAVYSPNVKDHSIDVNLGG